MILDNLPHVCNAGIRTRTQGALGGGKDTWTNVFTNKACWRQSASATELRYAEKMGILVTHKVFFVEDPEIDNKHSLVFSDGRYDVVSRPTPDSSVGLGVVWRVMLSYNSSEG